MHHDGPRVVTELRARRTHRREVVVDGHHRPRARGQRGPPEQARAAAQVEDAPGGRGLPRQPGPAVGQRAQQHGGARVELLRGEGADDRPRGTAGDGRRRERQPGVERRRGRGPRSSLTRQPDARSTVSTEANATAASRSQRCAPSSLC